MTSLLPVWPYAALVLIALGIVRLPVFRFLDAAAGGDTRFPMLDGLRGYLAFSVFVFHLAVTREFAHSGQWMPPASPFYSMLGPLGVSLFFMITGFLFWAKLLRVQGRPDWRALYVGRLFRIGPMYLVAVVTMLIIVFWRTGAELREPAWVVVAAVAQWLALGLIDVQPDVNGYRARHVLAGVTWTIWYEWWYYASLLVTARLARSRWQPWPTAGLLLLCLAGRQVVGHEALAFAALFAGGMLVASLLHANAGLRLPDRIASALIFGCLLLVFVSGSGGYGSLSGLLLMATFYLICSGASLFGLLSGVAARRLGQISYGLYLLQGIVLTLVFALPPLRELALSTQAGFWAVGVLCTLVLVAVAAVCYALVERPGIAIGHALVRRRTAAVAQGASQALRTPGLGR